MDAKVPTIYIVGGSRAKRLAAHARQKLPDPRTSDSYKAFDVAEVGDPVVHPVRETGMTWLAIMRACELQEGDIITLDMLNTSSWMDAAAPKQPLPEPHMLAPTIPPVAENKRLQDAIRAIRAVCGAFMVNVIMVILPPQARYMGGPCCKDHMPLWSSTLSPPILMESLMRLDQELVEVFDGLSNAAYISVSELAAAVEGSSIPVHTAWASMTARSNVYINSKSMRVVTDLIIGKATDAELLAKSYIDTCRRVWVMQRKPLDKLYEIMRAESENESTTKGRTDISQLKRTGSNTR